MADRKSVISFTQRHGRRVGVTIAGVAVLVVGFILSLPLVPGPGILVMLAGLAILATEYEWARRLLTRARQKWRAAVDRARGRPRVVDGDSPPTPRDDRDEVA